MVPVFSPVALDAQVDLVETLRAVIDGHEYVLGHAVAAFEEGFAEYCGVEHAVGVANGTDALELALRALGVGPKDEVIVAANAGCYSSTAVRAVGASPVFADVDPDTLTLSAASLSAVLDGRKANVLPAAVVVTHLYGQLAQMEELNEVAASVGTPVIEDSAQAHGAERDGRKAGAFGRIGCFSFYPTKNLGAIGDAGAIVTNDAALADRVRRLRQYGWGDKFRVEMPGGRNSRLDEIQAAVLLRKLPLLDGWNRDRRNTAQRYAEELAGLPLGLPASMGPDYVAHLFVVRTPARDALRDHLAERGIGSAIHYPVPDHQQPAYARHASDQRLPVTEAVCETVLTLPCYPGLSTAAQDLVIEAVRDFFAGQVA